MFEFLGKLVGVSMRQKLYLPFSLPSIVWKQLVSEEVRARRCFSSPVFMTPHALALVDAVVNFVVVDIDVGAREGARRCVRGAGVFFRCTAGCLAAAVLIDVGPVKVTLEDVRSVDETTAWFISSMKERAMTSKEVRGPLTGPSCHACAHEVCLLHPF
jgi:hypothetical protein